MFMTLTLSKEDGSLNWNVVTQVAKEYAHLLSLIQLDAKFFNSYTLMVNDMCEMAPDCHMCRL
jgi:hypothetical protein